MTSHSYMTITSVLENLLGNDLTPNYLGVGLDLRLFSGIERVLPAVKWRAALGESWMLNGGGWTAAQRSSSSPSGRLPSKQPQLWSQRLPSAHTGQETRPLNSVCPPRLFFFPFFCRLNPKGSTPPPPGHKKASDRRLTASFTETASRWWGDNHNTCA